MSEPPRTGRVRQLRLVVEASDYEQAVAFYRDVLGAGEELTPRLRVALEVTDAEGVTRELVEGGAELIAPPTETPWRSLNSRLSAPAGLQITVFQELDRPADA